MNELRALLHESVAAPPHDDIDLGPVLRTGRRRVRRRRTTVVGGAALAIATLATATAALAPGGGDDADVADGRPVPDAPTLRLADADRAVPGQDYRELASYTNENLNRDNGQYFDGVTDDGLVLFRDGPRARQLYPRYALMDPGTGAKNWLPRLSIGQTQAWPVELGAERLVLLSHDESSDDGMTMGLVAHVFDRDASSWRTISWPDLPRVGFPSGDIGPDGRLYVRVPATRGQPPEGGWPTGPDGEADDADADGDTYDLWSVSLTDPADARAEGLRLGSFDFTDRELVWTDATNGDSGRVHVRDLRTGEEHSFDPRSGEKCNLLGFGATGDRIVMSQYCGTYEDEGRDDRVQVVDTDGDQVVTLQDSSLEGALSGDGDLVTMTSYRPQSEGTYVYDLGTDRFVRISDTVSSYGSGGPTPSDLFLWHTSVNKRRGATQHLGEWLG